MRSLPTELPVRWLGLDGLRGFAVIAVVLYHAGLVAGGFLGVDVFFVLSGFLITSLLLREQERAGRIALRRFYLRRVIRLYPALIVVATFCVLVALAAQQAVSKTVHDALVAVGYLANLFSLPSGLLDHVWTLALEEQFYLLWPPLLIFAVRRKRPWRYLPALLLLLAILLADVIVGRGGVVHTYVRAMGLPLGCALALTSGSTRLRAAGAGGFALVGLAVLVFLPGPFWLTTGWPVSLGAVLAVPAVALLVTSSIPVFEWSVLRWFGLRSYSLYLWHFPLISLTLHHAPVAVPHVSRIPLAVVASLVAAEASYRLVEVPFLRLRDRRTAPTPGVVSPVQQAEQQLDHRLVPPGQ